MTAVKNDHNFWDIRAAKYDKLFWTKDKSYLDLIIQRGGLKKNHVVLDVGTGTGTVAEKVKKYVKHVVAIDTSDAMLSQGRWRDVSTIKWDVGEALFSDAVFDRIFARMVFHHILDNLDRAILRCFDVLKKGGKIIVAEGLPPNSDPDIVNWFTKMFKLKEKRRTFLADELEFFLKKNGFRNVKTAVHIMEKFNVNNWLDNSGLAKKRQKQIYQMHVNADEKIKKAYKMQVKNGQCLIRTVNVIVTGQK